MLDRPRIVALLAANPAFAAIQSRLLLAAGFETASFTEPEALCAYLRIAPVDVVVIDAEDGQIRLGDLSKTLKAHRRLNQFEIVALTRAGRAFHSALYAAGIDLVLEKPVSPEALVAAIEGLDAFDFPMAAGGETATPRPWTGERHGNVIPLFGEGRRSRR